MAYESFLDRCKKSGINSNSVVIVSKKYVLVHRYVETDFSSIVAFSDSFEDLIDVRNCHPRFGSSRHDFMIFLNHPKDPLLNSVKDSNLINICENVAQYLSFGEYAMLKKSYLKSSAWFEKAKNSAFLASVILNNY